MAAPLRTLAVEQHPDLSSTNPEATILAFPQPDTTGQAVFSSEAVEAPDVDPRVRDAQQRIQAAEHVAWVACNAVAAQLEKEPEAPLSHPIKTWRYERRLDQLRARKDNVAGRLQELRLALANLEYGGDEYAPEVWVPEAPAPRPRTNLLRQAASAHLKTWIKTKLA